MLSELVASGEPGAKGAEPPSLRPLLEGKIVRVSLTTGGTPKEEQLEQFAQRGGEISSNTRRMIESDAFECLSAEVQVDIAIVRIGDLVPNPKGTYATTEEIFGREDDVDDQGNPVPFTRGKRSKLGLHLLPHQVPLDYLNEKGDDLEVGDPLWFATKPLTDRNGYPYLFGAERGDDGFWLYSAWSRPGIRWRPDRRIAFSLSQVTNA